MSDRIRIAGKLLARVRELGAAPSWDGARISIARSHKLPAEASRMFRDYAPELADLLRAERDDDAKSEFEERAAIIEHDGGFPRGDAERLARLLLANVPDGVDPADWSWFVGHAARIMDGVSEMRSAA